MSQYFLAAGRLCLYRSDRSAAPFGVQLRALAHECPSGKELHKLKKELQARRTVRPLVESIDTFDTSSRAFCMRAARSYWTEQSAATTGMTLIVCI